jgi:hypothetical protein
MTVGWISARWLVTMNTAKKLLLEDRSVWSGLEGQFLTNELADIFNLPPRATISLHRSERHSGASYGLAPRCAFAVIDSARARSAARPASNFSIASAGQARCHTGRRA